MKSKFWFYFLSCTWGLPMTLIGAIVSLCLMIVGYKPKKYGYCVHFVIGKKWGGLSLGPFMITDSKENRSLKAHEHGHSIQNCFFGPLMPFVVCIPSAIRYWYREYLVRSGRKKHSELPDYDSVWYEGSATTLGTKFINLYTQQND